MSPTKTISIFIWCCLSGIIWKSFCIEKPTPDGAEEYTNALNNEWRRDDGRKLPKADKTSLGDGYNVKFKQRKRRNPYPDSLNTTQIPRVDVNATTALLSTSTVYVTTKSTTIVCSKHLSCKGRCQQERHKGIKSLEENHCYCDPYCDSFKDCCADFDQFCSGSVSTKKLDDKWRCHNDIWMIDSCPGNSTLETVKKCQMKVAISALNYADVIPVTSDTGKTFKNRFCALCNGVSEEETKSLNLEFRKCQLTPSKSYSVKEKLKVLFKYCLPGKLAMSGEQRVRKCAFMTEQCTRSKPLEIRYCESGPYRIVFSMAGFQNFKNVHCARCELGEHQEGSLTCGPLEPFNLGIGGEMNVKSFTAILDVDGSSGSKTMKTIASCAADQVYDVFLETCRKSLQFPLKRSSLKLNKYNIAMWIESWKNNALIIRDIPYEVLFDSLSKRFGIKPSWFEFVEWENLDSASIDVLVVDLYIGSNATKRRPRREPSVKDEIDILLNFTRPVEFSIFGNNFTIIKATSRILTCVHVQYFRPKDYVVIQGSNSIFINETQEVLTEKDYFTNSTIKQDGNLIPDGTIAVCRQHLPSSFVCNGAYISLGKDEFVILVNNSVYRNVSNRVYNEGEYSIINGSVVVCTEYSMKYTKRARCVNPKTDTALLILTYIGLSLSFLCLVFVLMTYLLFEELRTLPGINLMNLSTALLVAHFFWLFGSGQTGSYGACVAIAGILHFTFLASFAWMSIIAFRTWKAFSSSGCVGTSTDKEHRRRRIRRSIAIGWLPVLALVVICLTLDQSGAVKIGYAGPKGCWINNGLANIVLFFLPLAVSVIWNAVFFGLTVKAIYKANKQTKMVSEQRENRRSFTVYVKIAVLMGFTWILGFLALLKSTYFNYPFVIFNTLQGLHIAVAFTFNQRVKKLYQMKFFKRNALSESTHSTNSHLRQHIAGNNRV